MAASILYALGEPSVTEDTEESDALARWLSILDTEAWGQTSIRAYKLGLAPVEDHLIFTLDGPPARGFDHSTFALEDPAAAVKRLNVWCEVAISDYEAAERAAPPSPVVEEGAEVAKAAEIEAAFLTELIKADDGDDSSDLAGTPPSEAVLWMRHKEAEVLPSPGSPPLNMKDTALSIPAIRRLYDARNLILAERDALLAARNLLLTRNAQAAADVQETTEDCLARAEGRLIITEYPYHPHCQPMEDAAGERQPRKRFRGEQDRYSATWRGVARHIGSLLGTPRDEHNSSAPFRANDWFPPLDGALLYRLIAEQSPRRFIEVDSGVSTRFARQAIQDGSLPTFVISIDPHPHTAGNSLCDEIICSRMEEVPRHFWEEIGPNDLLFIDNSHRRSFPIPM